MIMSYPKEFQRKEKPMPFVKGQSGNPAGRPRGCRNKRSAVTEAMLTVATPDVVQDVIIAARNHNPAAMRLLMARMLPPMREQPVRLRLPPIKSAADRDAAVELINEALGDGEITIGETEGLLRVVEREFKLLGPASRDLAQEVAQLREMMTRIAGRLGVEPAIDRINTESTADTAAAPGDGAAEVEAAIDRINTESMPDAAAAPVRSADARPAEHAEAAPSNNAAETAPAIDRINARSMPPGRAAPGPVADAPPVDQREPVNIRENTGFARDARGPEVAAAPFAGAPVPITISPDLWALIGEPHVRRSLVPSGEPSSETRANL